MTATPLRLGISRCLLGEEVRFDGGHKRDRFLTDVLGRYVEWGRIAPKSRPDSARLAKRCGWSEARTICDW